MQVVYTAQGLLSQYYRYRYFSSDGPFDPMNPKVCNLDAFIISYKQFAMVKHDVFECWIIFFSLVLTGSLFHCEVFNERAIWKFTIFY